MRNFSFDEMAALAVQDPAAFDAMRKNLLLAEVAKAAPSQREKLMALVEQLTAPQPAMSGLERAVHANNAMAHSLGELGRQWQRLSALSGGTEIQPSASDMVAQFTRLEVRQENRG